MASQRDIKRSKLKRKHLTAISEELMRQDDKGHNTVGYRWPMDRALMVQAALRRAGFLIVRDPRKD